MSSESSHVLLSARIPKETDRYAPWVKVTNTALRILKTVNVDNIRGPSPLNILAQRNDPNEVTISHGSDISYRKPDVVFMTEKELIKVHKIKTTARGWRTTLFERCQRRLPRLPTDEMEWKQFKATAEFKRSKGDKTSFPMIFSEELQSCRDGSGRYTPPQNLGDSTHVDDAPEEAGGDPVPKGCTFCFDPFSSRS